MGIGWGWKKDQALVTVVVIHGTDTLTHNSMLHICPMVG